MRRLNLAVFWISLMLLAASFGGAVHGLGDSLAVFRFWWALLLGVSSFFLLAGYFRYALLGLGAIVLGASPMLAGYMGGDGGNPFRYSLYQKNLLFNGTDPEAIKQDILEYLPDFVTLEEVSRKNRKMVAGLAQNFQSNLLCPFVGVGGVAIMSKWPMVEDAKTCAGNQGMAAMQVLTPDGPVWLVSLHLHWPYPHRQREQLAKLLPEIDRLDGPVILAGDFNMVPWSHTLFAVARATGSKRAGAVVNTYAHEVVPLRLPIDHVLVPGGVGRLEVRPQLGSDHFGLLLRFDL
ncbi:MAG: endonuclease/exonuclease/phosphatase family protein [Paracoccaceae bacterium]